MNESTQANRPMRADAQRNYASLLNTARVAVSERGADIVLEDVARSAGVAIGTLYRHFPTRQDLLEAVFLDEANELRVHAEELASALDPFDALISLLHLQMDFAARGRSMGAAIMAAKQVPARAQSFVGREEDLVWLLEPLMNEAGVTLALCGAGGMGKTALAAEALTRLIAQEDWLVRFPDGIFYHYFYAYPSLAVAFEELARVFGEEPGSNPRLAARRAVSRRRALLVFDGVESLADVRPLREMEGTLMMRLH
jgi:AcrR family transcriptional regulator